MSRPIMRSFIATLGLALSFSALAAGFAIKEQSPSSMGAAFAGASAVAEDASTLFFNGASISKLPADQLYVGANDIMPHGNLHRASATAPFPLIATPMPGTTRQSNVIDNGFVPNAYITRRTNAYNTFGLGITAPWGLSTDYRYDWVGRNHALSSDLRSVNLNPVWSYDITPHWAAAIGLQAQRIQARLTNSILSPILTNVNSEVEGDSWGYGYTVGTLFEPFPDTHMGISYRSRIQHTLEGHASTSLGARPDAHASVTMPDMVDIGVSHPLDKHWDLLGQATWTHWDLFDKLILRFKTPLIGSTTSNTTDEHWHNAWFYALGASYQFDTPWKVRFGVAYDQTPVPDKYRTPRIPDSDRYWAALGASFNINQRVAVDLSYTHLWVRDCKVNLAGSGNDLSRGGLNAQYDGYINIIAAGVSWEF